jgi:TatD DNase family protein
MSFAIGLHPLDAQKWKDDTAQEILTAAQSDRRVVAIGEMGLDFYKADNRDRQIEVFRAQLEIAYQLGKPVIIHCRDAAPELREILQTYQQEDKVIRGVMHCWSGTREETQWFLDLGFYISFSGIVTFKKAETVHNSAKIVPLDRLLVETDCPFLAPAPYRGKRNEPAYVRHVAEYLAQLRGISLEDLAEATTHNACQLFSLPFQPE